MAGATASTKRRTAVEPPNQYNVNMSLDSVPAANDTPQTHHLDATPSPMNCAATSPRQRAIRVGLSVRHGMADEMSKEPPEGVEYCFPMPTRMRHPFLRSPMKCFLWEFANDDEFDLLEGILSPVETRKPWLCSLDSYFGAAAFSFLGMPLPRRLRSSYLQRLFAQERCKQIIFWSEDAQRSMLQHGPIRSRDVESKISVVYPAIRIPPEVKRPRAGGPPQLLFSGDFFRKGGAGVVDAFEIVQQRHPEATLYVCSDPERDFNTRDQQLRRSYLQRVRDNPGIRLGRVPRERILNELLPASDAYLLPSFSEAFGFAILEAMARSVPVVATNVDAIPEILTDGESGLLVDLSAIRVSRFVKGYVVTHLPSDVHKFISGRLAEILLHLLDHPEEGAIIGAAGRQRVMQRFSFAQRNAIMSRIYRQALA